MPISRLDEIPNLTLEVSPHNQADLMKVIVSAVRVARDLTVKDFGSSINMAGFSGRALNVAGMSAIQSVNALISAVAGKCTLEAPPEEIEMTTKGGRLIYRCFHNPPHEFDLNGTQIL